MHCRFVEGEGVWHNDSRYYFVRLHQHRGGAKAEICSDREGYARCITVPLNQVFKYFPLAVDALDDFWKSHSTRALRAARCMVKALFGDTVRVEIDCDHISIMDGQITIQPEIIEVKAIGRVSEVAGWGVSTFRQRMSFNRDEPPDVDEATVGQARNEVQAANLACNAIFEDRIQGFIEGYMMNEDP